MRKPTHTRPDGNQRQIERTLQTVGFLVYRTADCKIYRNHSLGVDFHPLDLLVLGLNLHTHRHELTLWEIKVDTDAPVTKAEQDFFEELKYRCRNTEIPVRFAYSADDILDYYGRLQ